MTAFVPDLFICGEGGNYVGHGDEGQGLRKRDRGQGLGKQGLDVRKYVMGHGSLWNLYARFSSKAVTCAAHEGFGPTGTRGFLLLVIIEGREHICDCVCFVVFVKFDISSESTSFLSAWLLNGGGETRSALYLPVVHIVVHPHPHVRVRMPMATVDVLLQCRRYRQQCCASAERVEEEREVQNGCQ